MRRFSFGFAQNVSAALSNNEQAIYIALVVKPEFIFANLWICVIFEQSTGSVSTVCAITFFLNGAENLVQHRNFSQCHWRYQHTSIVYNMRCMFRRHTLSSWWYYCSSKSNTGAGSVSVVVEAEEHQQHGSRCCKENNGFITICSVFIFHEADEVETMMKATTKYH